MKTFARAALIAVMLSTAAVPALAQTTAPTAAESLFRATTLNLSAYGEERVAPDMANITLGVMTQAKTASEAMTLNSAQMNRVIAALRAKGIAEKDIQTSNLNLSPQYVYRENEPPLLSGYQASNQVTIRVLDLTKLGAAIDAVVSAGANQIQGINFGLVDPKAAEDAARRKAVTALAAKASLYASATGHRVQRLVNLSEGGGYSAPPPMPMANMMRMEKSADSTSVLGGELAIRVDVNATYELTR